MTAYPRAVGRFGPAALQTRAARTGEVLQPAPPPRRTVVRLWLPLSAMFLLLAPFALLIAPLGYLVPRSYRVRPFAAALALGQLLMSLSGTDIAIDTPAALVRLKIL